MSVKRGLIIFVTLTVVQTALYFSGVLMGLIMLPIVGVFVWVLWLPGSLLFSFFSDSSPALMSQYRYLEILPILFNSVLYTVLLDVLCRVGTRFLPIHLR